MPAPRWGEVWDVDFGFPIGHEQDLKRPALVVSSESQDVGDGDQEIPAEYDADAMTLRLNSRYLEQFLEVCETEKVHLFVKDEGSQCQGRPAEAVPGLKSYLYVVMPMRV